MLFSFYICTTKLLKIVVMKKIFVSLAFMASLGSCLYAQEKVTLKAGTMIPMVATSMVKAAEVNEGSTVMFRVNKDIIVDGKKVIENGTLVKGNVVEAAKSSPFGTKGRLIISIPKILLSNGEPVYLADNTTRIFGKNRTPLAVGLGIFCLPCFLIPGTKAVMPEGHEICATVAGNTEVVVK